MSDSDYVHMGDGRGVRPGTTVKVPDGLDDPDLSQEERDLRLAIALQQQENAAAYDAHKKKHNAAVKGNELRTTRSNTQTRLAAVRDKDHGMLRVPKEYSSDNAYSSDGYKAPSDGDNIASLKGASPQEIADYKLAAELQKFEKVGAGTAQEMQKIITEEQQDKEAQEKRTRYTATVKRGFGN